MSNNQRSVLFENGEIAFSASAALEKRLGEELIKDSQTAFFELIKNSYDADATQVHVRISCGFDPDKARIIIEDDGTGMSVTDLREKWTRVASENKVRDPYSGKFKRRRLGMKGIGRFSVGRLGRHLKLVTKHLGDDYQTVAKLNLDAFTDDKDLSDMKLGYRCGEPKTGLSCGTILEITGLRDNWSKREVSKLKDQLCHLVDPEEPDQSFSILVDYPDHPELSGPLANPIAGKESHKLHFRMDDKGEHIWEFWRGDKLAKRSRLKGSMPSCGPVKGMLRYYSEGLKRKDRALASGAEESHMGVKVIRDHFRVRPYGEDADDWLQIKEKRASAGGKYYVNPANLAGTVYISLSSNSQLRDETNRESGMIHNQEYTDFQRFVQEHVDLLNDFLAQEAKSESQKQRRQSVEKTLNTVINCLSQQESPDYKKYVDNIDRSRAGAHGITTVRKDSQPRDLKVPTKREWHCLDCDERWRTLSDLTPIKCLEYAVNRKGDRRNATGCESTNIEPARHDVSSDTENLSSIVAGQYALVSGKKINVRIDYEMGENEDEFSLSEREIVLNGNHLAYKVAEKLDGMTGKRREVGDQVFVPALTVHISKCVCLAWAEFHYRESGSSWLEYRNRFEELQSSIYRAIKLELMSE